MYKTEVVVSNIIFLNKRSDFDENESANIDEHEKF
jgi:hypothetical protein